MADFKVLFILFIKGIIHVIIVIRDVIIDITHDEIHDPGFTRLFFLLFLQNEIIKERLSLFCLFLKPIPNQIN